MEDIENTSEEINSLAQIDEAQLKKKIDDFVNDIKEIDPSTAHRLIDIRDSFNEDAFWINLDLFGVINPTAFSEIAETSLRIRNQKSRWIVRFERIRNILVLLPIGLTWFGLSSASIAYTNSVTNDPNLITRPFLLQWQEGFPNNSSFVPSFSSVAITDTIIIGLVIGITWWVMKKDSDISRETAISVSQLRKKLETLLWEISQAAKPLRARMAEKSETKLVGLIDSLSQVLIFLQKHNKDFNELLEKQYKEQVRISEERKKEFTNLKGITEGFERVVNKLEAFSDQFMQVLENSNNSMKSVETTVSALSTQIKNLEIAINNWERAVKSEVKNLTETTQDSYKRADIILENIPILTGTIEKLTKAQNELVKFFEDQKNNNQVSSLQLNAAIELMSKELGQARLLFASLTDAAKGLKVAFDKSNQYSESIFELSGKVTSAFAELANVMGGLKADLSGIDTNIKKSIDLTSDLPAQIKTVSARLLEVKHLSDDLQNLQKSMQEFNLILNETSNTMGATHYSNLEFSKTLKQEIGKLGAILQGRP